MKFVGILLLLVAISAHAALMDDWELNDTTGTTVVDSGSGAHNGVSTDNIQGGANGIYSSAGATATTGTSLSSDSTGRVTVSHATGFPFVGIGTGQSTTGFAFGIWMKGSSGSVLAFGSFDPVGGDYDWQLNVSGAGAIVFYAKGSSADVASCNPSVSISGTWHHWVGTYDGTNMRLYEDGAIKCTAAGPAAGYIRTTTTSNMYLFGTSSAMLTGSLDVARLYNTTCTTDADCQAIFCDSGGSCPTTPTPTATATITPTVTPTTTPTPIIMCTVTANCPAGFGCVP